MEGFGVWAVWDGRAAFADFWRLKLIQGFVSWITPQGLRGVEGVVKVESCAEAS